MICKMGHVGDRNPHVYLIPLCKVWEIFKDTYDARNIVIVDYLKENHICNDEGNYVITKGYNCENMSGTYLLD